MRFSYIRVVFKSYQAGKNEILPAPSYYIFSLRKMQDSGWSVSKLSRLPTDNLEMRGQLFLKEGVGNGKMKFPRELIPFCLQGHTYTQTEKGWKSCTVRHSAILSYLILLLQIRTPVTFPRDTLRHQPMLSEGDGGKVKRREGWVGVWAPDGKRTNKG